MVMRLYNILMMVGIVVASPVLLWLGWARGHSVRERVGIYNGRVKNFLNGKRPIWFHAASVGEVRVLAALIPAYLHASHEKKIIVSTVTRSGRLTAEKILPKECLAVYSPLDLRIFVKRAFKVINPRVLVLTETEFWPNLMEYAHQSGVRMFCVNGRISKKSFPRYKIIKPFLQKLLAYVEIFIMQSEADAERLIRLGVAEKNVVVSGNIKFDLGDTDERLRKTFSASKRPSWVNGERILVAGSTHRGEELVILKAFSRIKDLYDGAILILAPRHLNRIDELKLTVMGFRLSPFLKSELDMLNGNSKLEAGSVVILDTMGELQYVYNWGEAAFVGGSLNRTGGHNPLEPAAWSKPIAFGPNMQNCQEISQSLVDCGGARIVRDADELFQFFKDMLSDPDKRDEMGNRAGLIFQKNSGVSTSVAERLFGLISHKKAENQPTVAA